MKIFFDSEFTGLHQSTTFISLGLITENNQTFYAEFVDYDQDQVDDWLEENVINNLCLPMGEIGLIAEGESTEVRGRSTMIQAYLTDWILSLGAGPHEMWGDTLAYDWVLFCNLWGDALSILETIYYIPFDLATLFKAKGVDPDISRVKYANMEGIGKAHNALFDARVIKACHERLTGSDNSIWYTS